jgi:hypothetical protein
MQGKRERKVKLFVTRMVLYMNQEKYVDLYRDMRLYGSVDWNMASDLTVGCGEETAAAAVVGPGPGPGPGPGQRLIMRISSKLVGIR